MAKLALQAAAFIEQLPRRPYCTDDPAHGLQIRPQVTRNTVKPRPSGRGYKVRTA